MSTTEPVTAWDHRRRVLAQLVVCIGAPAVLCLQSGVVARGPLGFEGGRFCVGATVFYAEKVGSITVEPDLITIHLGPLA